VKESKLTKDLIQYTIKYNAYWLTLVGSNPMQQAGLPDRILFHKYLPRPAFLEMKNNDNKLSAIQNITLNEINKRQPFTAFVVRFHNLNIAIQYNDMTLALCNKETFITSLTGIMTNEDL